MSRFRLVIFDNPKAQLDSPDAKTLLADMIFEKQKNFLRTDPHYVVMDKHDMIGTHYLIYDTQSFLKPKLIFAIRTTFLSRAREHHLETPLMALLPHMDSNLQEKFKQFHGQHPDLVDCNAWFVDAAYSKKNSGLNLSDLGYFMVCTHLMRWGYDNIVGCTNETYNASRWLENVGTLVKGEFVHPVVKAVHMMILVSPFNREHFAQVYAQYSELVSEAFELLPEQDRGSRPSFAEFSANLYAELYGEPSKIRKKNVA